MNSKDYQRAVTRTMGDHLSREEALANWSMGLAGEAGEAVDLLKKHLFHGHDLDLSEAAKEIGDVLWYVTALCETLGLDLGTVMWRNVEKLRARYPEGFSKERSRHREIPSEARWVDALGNPVDAPEGKQIGDLYGVRLIRDESLVPGTFKLLCLTDGEQIYDSAWMMNAEHEW